MDAIAAVPTQMTANSQFIEMVRQVVQQEIESTMNR
jgi:hypothetical protein